MNVQITEGAWKTVEAAGEIDLSNVEEFKEALLNTLQESPRGIIINLTDLIYIDSAGVAAIISAYRKAINGGGQIAIIRPALASVRRTLDLIGLNMLPDIFICENSDAAESILENGRNQE